MQCFALSALSAKAGCHAGGGTNPLHDSLRDEEIRRCLQVGAIQSVQVDIENEVKDQRETRKNEERKLRHWHKETAKKREQIAAAFADGACQPRLRISAACALRNRACMDVCTHSAIGRHSDRS